MLKLLLLAAILTFVLIFNFSRMNRIVMLLKLKIVRHLFTIVFMSNVSL